MDILPFAVELAKVTMMIGRKLAIDELHIDEPALPLDNLDANFQACDALIDPSGKPTAWPKVDVIIGNPPFLGAKRLKPERGPDYVNAIRRLYPDVPGMADYCVYWLRKAHDHLPPCTAKDPFAGRAGLVGTQNIRNNKSRVGGLDHIVKTGTIIEAVDNQPWSGEANVHVSIVDWVKTQDAKLLPKRRRLWSKVDPPPGAKKPRRRGSGPASKEFELDSRECEFINSALSDKTDVSGARALRCNVDPQRVFQGMTPGYDGFVLSVSEAKELIIKDKEGRSLLRPYLIGRELLSGDRRPQRFIIDADEHDLLSLSQFSVVFEYLKKKVLPAVRTKLDEVRANQSDMIGARTEHLNRWWTFWARRIGLRKWLRCHKRIIASSRTQSWPFIFDYISTSILPGDKLQLFAFDDDYSLGIIQSMPHCSWYQAKGARLKNEVDYNYSSKSVFDTFPWPQKPSVKRIGVVAAAGREVRRVREEALAKVRGGLRAVYRTLELPGKNPLRDAHAALDAAVLEAYDFSPRGDMLAQLLELNLSVAAQIASGEPVAAPGVPSSYPDPERLMSEDCVRAE